MCSKLRDNLDEPKTSGRDQDIPENMHHIVLVTDVNIHGWRMPQLNCHQNPQLRLSKIGAHGALNCSGER